jgi:hypothetical protein
MVIETTKGPVDDAELEVERVEIDDAQAFGYELRYRQPGSPGVVCVMRQVKIWKFDPLTEVTTARGIMKLADLDVTTGFVDNADEYTRWIEYRPKGETEIVSRSAHVSLKRTPWEASGVAATFTGT